MKITVDQDVCIGAASCVALASKTFSLNQEGKVYVLVEDGDSRDAILEAARSCPVFAIKLFEDDGTEIAL
jgi:ferredoxin